MYEEKSSSLIKNDLLKHKFKYYKSNKPKPCLNDVISVDVCNDKVVPVPVNIENDSRTELLGLHKESEWKLFSFIDNPGLYLIRNPFTAAGQKYWIRQCLEVYPRKPNKLNIDNEMWLEDWWVECYRSGKCERSLQKKLRWTTLGYHHNWDTKIYSEDNKTSFPEDLAELSDVLARYLSYDNYKAEAAIVNYYRMDSTLSAHTDHSEVNLDAPLFSISFGQSAIFLLGGEDKSIDPSAILLQSGDIVVMSKEARLCYHAVPKILPAISMPWNDKDHCMSKTCDVNILKYLKNQDVVITKMNNNLNDSEWSSFGCYIQESRINMNVRQVLNENQNSLCGKQFIDTLIINKI